MDNSEEGERRSPTNARDPGFEIPDEVAYNLKKPFKRVAGGDEVISRLTFRPPMVGEVKKVQRRTEKDGEAAATIMMMSLLCNDKLTEPDVERINFVDFQLCMEELQPFFGIGRAFSEEELSRAIHNLAWFWRVPPREVWDCPVDRFMAWLRETERIADEIEAARRDK